MKYKEENLQIQICDYLKIQYPRAFFTCESAGINRSIAAAKKAQRTRSNRGIPDLMIFNPSANGQYHSLFLELKKDDISIIVKIGERKGQLVANEHINEQYASILALRNIGHWADFAVGFEEAKRTIDAYFDKYATASLQPNYSPII